MRNPEEVVRRIVFLFLLYSVASVTHAAPQTVQDMLTHMQTALRDLNYYGILVYLQDGNVQTMRVIHKADKDGESERLISLNGVAREIIRKGDIVTCYMPDKKEVTVGKRQYNRHILPKLAENSFDELQRFYDFKLESEDRVAGNKTQRILIQPKDKLRYGYRLWLGEDNYLLLKSDLINSNGEVLEQAMFADINVVNQIPAEMLKPSSSSEGFSRFEQHKKANGIQQVSNSEWTLKNLPKGFSISTHIRQTLPDSEHPAEHWIATDGLASVSVYLEKVIDKKHAFEGLTRAGAMNVFGLLLDGYHVTVVGEVPARTVEMIARSVVMNPAGH